MAPSVLVTGATGYIGGRLVPRLLTSGHAVRAMVRNPSRLEGRGWLDDADVVQGDVLDPETLAPAMDGVSTAYYLIHSMTGGGDFHERDLRAARSFAEAARRAGVERIVYLGGLGDPDVDLSPHLRSRQETGDALRSAGVPVTELRAAVVVGSGSVSFEMVRYLTERLPVMICPRWVFTRTQPISIRNLLDYLVAVLETPESTGRVIEIGGQDVVTYGEMMLGYAEVRELPRRLVAVPVLTPRLSSYWVHLVTPIPSSIAQPLIQGLSNEAVVRDDVASQMFPSIELLDYRTSVALALGQLDAGSIETSWSDALGTSQGDAAPVQLTTERGMIIERRELMVDAPAEFIYQAFTSIGGERGWLHADWMWRLRGLIDRLAGGVGLRRGRRDADKLRVGDALDFWRVEAIEPGRLMRLRAEMRLPGLAWLQFEAREPVDGPQATGEARPADESQLAQTAIFAPKGLMGLLYWYALYPLHSIIFGGMPKALGRRAEALYASSSRREGAQEAPQRDGDRRSGSSDAGSDKKH